MTCLALNAKGLTQIADVFVQQLDAELTNPSDQLIHSQQQQQVGLVLVRS